MAPETVKRKERRDEAKRRLKRRRLTLFPRIRAYFLAGVLVTGPIAITLAVAWWLIELVDRNIVPLIPAQWNPDTYLRETVGFEFGLPGLGLVVLFIVITLIGALTAGFLGRTFLNFGERILARMPVVRGLYGAVKQMFETVLKQQSNAFRQAVLVEWPRRDSWTIAFITGDTKGEIKEHLDGEFINVYVPTTPNPTSGFLLYVPANEVKILDMNVEDALKMVISLGIVTPDENKAPKGGPANGKSGKAKPASPATPNPELVE